MSDLQNRFKEEKCTYNIMERKESEMSPKPGKKSTNNQGNADQN